MLYKGPFANVLNNKFNGAFDIIVNFVLFFGFVFVLRFLFVCVFFGLPIFYGLFVVCFLNYTVVIVIAVVAAAAAVTVVTLIGVGGLLDFTISKYFVLLYPNKSKSGP